MRRREDGLVSKSLAVLILAAAALFFATHERANVDNAAAHHLRRREHFVRSPALERLAAFEGEAEHLLHAAGERVLGPDLEAALERRGERAAVGILGAGAALEGRVEGFLGDAVPAVRDELKHLRRRRAGIGDSARASRANGCGYSKERSSGEERLRRGYSVAATPAPSGFSERRGDLRARE